MREYEPYGRRKQSKDNGKRDPNASAHANMHTTHTANVKHRPAPGGFSEHNMNSHSTDHPGFAGSSSPAAAVRGPNTGTTQRKTGFRHLDTNANDERSKKQRVLAPHRNRTEAKITPNNCLGEIEAISLSIYSGQF